ncbi:uncharacterized protein LOC129296137 [Prosopis cineraria]|uniref:uncharacterized protein LOC129296137 n=1 Tax=Prosopis cineraria TaxID=364024 RepID=UPI00240EABFF|nr:uncharacterized protein LOC129296137 [Prosopis cineraria]
MEDTTKGIIKNPRSNTKFEDLPQHLIHHMMMHFLLYKDATKLSVLSKAFHSLWLSCPVLHFDYKFFEQHEDPHDSFKSFILKTLHLRRPQGPLRRQSVIYPKGNSTFNMVFDALLHFAIENNTKEIVFYMSTNHSINVRYDSLLRLISSQCLTVLNLEGFIKFPIADLIILCPRLKELEITRSEGLQTVTVSSLSLEKACICHSLELNELKEVHLKAKNLRYCSFVDLPHPCEINLSACESIKDIYVCGVKVTKNLIELVTGSLNISECDFPENLSIHNPRIKELQMMRNNVKKMELLTPNLEYFRSYMSFEGQRRALYNISACVALKVLDLDGVTEKMELKNDKLEKLSLSACSNLNEAIVDAPNLINFCYEECPIIMLPVYPIVKILSTKCISAEIKLPTRYNLIDTHSCLFEYDKNVKRRKIEETCCSGISTKCWRHYKLKVHIQGFESVRSDLEEFFAPYMR